MPRILKARMLTLPTLIAALVTALIAMSSAAIFLAGCSEIAVRSNHNSDSPFEGGGNQNNQGGARPPIVIPSTGSGGATVATAPAAANKKVAVILGPGGFKAFAHAGVIKELRKANIPIDTIVGVEWGALVAGLYAQHAQIHEAEWKLYKLEKLDLTSTVFFSRKHEVKSLKALQGFLAENLGTRDAAQSTTPFYCPSIQVSKGVPVLQKSGPINRVVENCLASPPLFTPQYEYVADMFNLDEIIRGLKNSGFGIVILVNVLGEGNLFDKIDYNEDYATALLWDEARRAIWQAKSQATDNIDVTTQGIAMNDFESRKILVTAGEAAGEKAAHLLLGKYGF